MKTMKTMTTFGRTLAALALLQSACDGELGSNEKAATSDDTSTPDDSPRYLIHSAVQTDDNRLNYFTLVDDLEEAREIDYSRSLEIPGRARLYAARGIGFFAIGGGETPTLTRYELRDDGGLEPGESISLQSHGVARMGAQSVLFVSPTKAYYKDDAQAQIIVWNPSAMVVDGIIELPDELIEDGWLTNLSQWASREGEAYLAVGWTSETYDRVAPGTALVRIDTATDEIEITRDDRCRGINKTANVDGTLYFFSDVINGFGYAVYGDEGGQQDCILRIPADSTTFDSEYVGTIAPALSEDQVGTIISVTQDGEAWAQVVDTSMVPTAPGTTYSEWYASGWSWWHLPLDTLDDPQRVDGDPGAYSGFTLASDSNFFVSVAAADYSKSTLVDLSGQTPKPGISFPGFTLDVARVR